MIHKFPYILKYLITNYSYRCDVIQQVSLDIVISCDVTTLKKEMSLFSPIHWIHCLLVCLSHSTIMIAWKWGVTLLFNCCTTTAFLTWVLKNLIFVVNVIKCCQESPQNRLNSKHVCVCRSFLEWTKTMTTWGLLDWGLVTYRHVVFLYITATIVVVIIIRLKIIIIIISVTTGKCFCGNIDLLYI